MALQDGVVGQLLDGVHRIVPADVDECLNLQLVHDFEQLLIDFRILMDLRQLIAAGAQESRRRPLQELDVDIGMNLCGQVHILLVQEALNAVEHSVYLVEASLLGGLVDPRQAGIDHSGRAAGLTNDDVTFFCHF